MPKHITIGLIEAFKTLGQTLANNIKNLLKQYGLTKKITYVKDKGANMNAMIVVLKVVVNCEALDEILKNYGKYFRHCMPSLMPINMQLLMKEFIKVSNMFP